MAVALDDSLVKAWIVSGLTGESQRAADASTYDLGQEKTLDQVRSGWRQLKGCRDSGQSENLELAAAEHYLFARLIASKDGDTEYRDFPKMYESLKEWASEADMQSYLQTSQQPVSPVSSEVTAWGEQGVEAGLSDYTKRTGESPTNKWGSYNQLIYVTYGYYYKFYPETSSCGLIVS